MPWVLTDGFPDDPSHTDVADEDIVREQILRPDVERTGDGARETFGSAERPATHCQICGRGLDARLTCPACGDELEDAA